MLVGLNALVAAGLTAVLLAPAGIAIDQYQERGTLAARVAKLERTQRVIANALYLKPTGALPVALDARMKAEAADVRIEGVIRDLNYCIRFRSVTLEGQDGPDRVAVVHPTCFGFIAMP